MAIIDNLVSFWELGNINDAHSSNTLTNNNAVTFPSGLVGNAAQFTAASVQSLSHSDNSALRFGNIDQTFNGWLYIDAYTAGHLPVIFKCTAAGDFYEYLFYINQTTHKFTVNIADGVVTTVVNITSTAVISTGAWYNWSFKFNATSGNGSLKINNGTADTASKTGTPAVNAGSFRIGGRADAVDATNVFNGRMDQIALFKTLLSDADETWLYNSGAGRAYAEISADSFKSAWVGGSNIIL